MRYVGTLTYAEYLHSVPGAGCFPVLSSDGVTVYNVRMLADGSLVCDPRCGDYRYRGWERPCKHINRVRHELRRG